ncbi:tetratricopeptide repeat protein 39C isoform X2 [Dendroctonus ponderosae]
MACSAQSASLGENTSSDEESPEWILARQGINLLINNGYAESEALFCKFPNSLVMYAGYSFTVFMDALMSFEEEKLSKAIVVLKEVEKRCTAQTGWFKSISQKVFGSSIENAQTLADQLETQIILADSQVCLAIITFLQQDLSGYFKGGWVLRKAWKVYQRSYKDILTLYKEKVGALQLPDPIPTPLTPICDFNGPATEFDDESEADWDLPEPQFNGQSEVIDKKTIMRLMEAVSFGYGLFQLGVSLLPPSLTRLISFLGFAANRQNGISCLMYARLGVDMRAPLASLALLWYHTIVRPFYAIDGVKVQAGVDAATLLIKESQNEFGNSALFLFFAGRTSRLNSSIPSALDSFEKAKQNANHREIKILCLHEIGWCHLIELDYSNARNTFVRLKHASRWSMSFYIYLAAICIGAVQDFANFSIFAELRKSSRTSRAGQLDDFLRRRVHCCPKDLETAKSYTSFYFKLLVFEMLYLWNALASCSREKVDLILTECKNMISPSDEPRLGLANLILGSCHSIKGDLKLSAIYFRNCLSQRKNELATAEDAHISAFAQYELGHILTQSEETREEGKLLLEQMNRYSHYDFEARLNVRIHSILRHLE